MKKTVAALSLMALLLISAAGVASAQIPFLPQLLNRFSEFNRLYSEKQKAGADLSSIEPLRVKAEEDFKRGNLTGIIEDISQATALLQGKKWDDALRFADSLTLETGSTVVQTNQPLRVSLSQMYPADDSKAFNSTPTVTFTVERRSGTIESPEQGPVPFKPLVLADHMAIGLNITETEERVRIPDGAYSVVAKIEADGKVVEMLSRDLYAINDFPDRIAKLSTMIAAIKSSTSPKVKSVAALVSTPEYELRQLANLDSRGSVEKIDVPAELERLESVLDGLKEGTDPLAAERGELERAYKNADAKLTPYGVYVPKSYDGSHPVPLVVALHGALGNEKSYLSGIYDPETMKGELERRGWILATPIGPGLIGRYDGKGEADVLDVIKQVTSEYKIDPSRIYLTGHSMGGFGTWQVASDHPELFAAIAPVSGGSPVPPAQLPALLAKLKGIPIFVVHGAKDGIVAPAMSRQMVEAAKRAGLQVTYLEVAGADHLTVVGPTFPKIMEFFDKNRKQN